MPPVGVNYQGMRVEDYSGPGQPEDCGSTSETTRNVRQQEKEGGSYIEKSIHRGK